MTENDILAAQQTWGSGVVAIGAAADWQTARDQAAAFVERMYVTDGSLLFKPTKASEQQFRPTVESAVSYFVGQNPSFPEDKGFALEPWMNVRFENTGIVSKGDVILTMGNYFFQPLEGEEVKVEYTFVYEVPAVAAGALRILLHHSALPYSGS